jgi:ADP-heptose:LPS heptosyltransferase
MWQNFIGKNLKIIGLRPSKGGDIITSLPVLDLLEQKYPNSYKTVSIAKKNYVFAQLLFNHPLIDRIYINEILEKEAEEDINFYNSHDIIIRPDLQHPDPYWYNKYHMVEENFIMMGMDWNDLDISLRTPRLIKWFDHLYFDKTIAIWPMAGSGLDIKRSPSQNWYQTLVDSILKHTDFKIFQFGHPNDFLVFNDSNRFTNYNHLDFFEQIKMTLGCSFMIGTDAGSSLVMGAYEFPQITLLTDWMENHVSNFEALSPLNKNNISIFAHGGCDNIQHDQVLLEINNLIK